MADRTKDIANIEAALASGVRQVSINGETTIFQSRAELLAELERLRADDDASKEAGKTRPVLSRFDLGRAW
ncbi:MAG: hypothetical protein AAGF31_03295 [Planctomycetota bacterium]